MKEGWEDGEEGWEEGGRKEEGRGEGGREGGRGKLWKVVVFFITDFVLQGLTPPCKEN
jgi:hypothetical protein